MGGSEVEGILAALVWGAVCGGGVGAGDCAAEGEPGGERDRWGKDYQPEGCGEPDCRSGGDGRGHGVDGRDDLRRADGTADQWQHGGLSDGNVCGCAGDRCDVFELSRPCDG